jgi:hypothetical protein
LKTETREVPAKAVAILPPAAAAKSSDGPVTAAKPARTGSQDRPGLAAAKSSAGTKLPGAQKPTVKTAVAKPVTVGAATAKTATGQTGELAQAR